MVAFLAHRAEKAGAGYPRHSEATWEDLRLEAVRQHQAGRPGRGRVVRGEFGPVPARADCYRARPGLIDALRQLAASDEGARQWIVCGMGGVGKTQLAAQYARDLYEAGGVEVLVWVNATSHSAVVDAYAGASARLLDASQDNPQAAADLFRKWLQQAPGTGRGRLGARWLVVLDDVPHVQVLQNLWPPDVSHGQTLVTTRNRDAVFLSTGRSRVDVDRFTTRESVEYLSAKLARHGLHDTTEETARLAEDLGRLPLALAQAVPYMVNRRLDCATYRARLANRARSLDDVLPPDTGLPDDQALTVAAAWDLSIDLADQQPPRGLARPMLHLLSLLDPNGIPEPVLLSPPARGYLTGHAARPGAVGKGLTETQDASDALANLRQFSLIEHDAQAGSGAVRVHQLIQRAVSERLSDEDRTECARDAADALLDVWPGGERDMGLAAALRSNAGALTSGAEDALYTSEAHGVLFRLGTSLGGVGRAAEAWVCFQALAQSVERHLGREHSDYLIACGHLAYWQGEAGDAVGAVNALDELLPRLRNMLGADHPETFVVRHGLAYWRGQAGNAVGAAAEFAELLMDHRRVLGDDHPDTLTVRHDLARWRGEAGEQDRAVADLADLLPDMTRILGAEHRNTLATRHSLARWRGEAGDAEGAAAALAELLPDLERVMGVDHPDTLSACNDHARWLGEAGDAQGAATALTELVPRRERVLGELHPDTLVTRHRLAHWRGKSGDPHAAVRELRTLWPDMIQALHQDDRRVFAVRQDLAFWYGEAGDPRRAVAHLAQLLTDMRRALRADDPYLFVARYSHARRLGEAGDVPKAVAELVRLLLDIEDVLPADAPLVKTARELLARCRDQDPGAG
ncbi:FxSxx-COOH system tetratricopeptide repeat protein [Streptomyces sp. NPDC086519]|uniref:FxSxx-COOH system tetratricopeptide repeat protein n=1 Tax=Streptomyces sp. NPDC086519 TaxID=3154863 RepID=UPI00341FC811